MKTIRYIVVALVLGFAAFDVAHAQVPITESDTLTNDFRARVELEYDVKVTRHLSLGIENSARFKDGLKAFDRNYLTGSLSYKPIEYFKTGAGYTFMSIWHDGKKKTGYKKYWDLRHRAYVYVAGILPVGQWKFSLQERCLTTFRTLKYDPLEKVNPEFILRSKVSVQYASRRYPLYPYLSVEVSNTLNVPEYVSRNYICDVRNKIGLKWRLTQSSYLDFYYRFDIGNEKDVNIDYKRDDVTIKGVDIRTEKSFTHILGIAYSFKSR